MGSLAVKYRPQKFEEIVGQSTIVKTIVQGINNKRLSHSIVLSGPAGTGKTSDARLIADALNGVQNSAIEIDAASNNSVDDVREIIETAGERAVGFVYKVYIIDECHALSKEAWQALLKLIEEPPVYTYFIFCTTDPQKIPATIISRCQTFRFNKIATQLIKNRLVQICNSEQIQFDDKALDYIAKMADGGMRQAITYLDKCKEFSDVVTLESVRLVLGDCTYDTMFSLTNAIIDGKFEIVYKIIDYLYNGGTDLKVFIAHYLDFILQLSKYCTLKSLDIVQIPKIYEENIKYTTGIENNSQWFSNFLDKVLRIKQAIKSDNDMKTTIEVMLTSKAA